MKITQWKRSEDEIGGVVLSAKRNGGTLGLSRMHRGGRWAWFGRVDVDLKPDPVRFWLELPEEEGESLAAAQKRAVNALLALAEEKTLELVMGYTRRAEKLRMFLNDAQGDEWVRHDAASAEALFELVAPLVPPGETLAREVLLQVIRAYWEHGHVLARETFWMPQDDDSESESEETRRLREAYMLLGELGLVDRFLTVVCPDGHDISRRPFATPLECCNQFCHECEDPAPAEENSQRLSAILNTASLAKAAMAQKGT